MDGAQDDQYGGGDSLPDISVVDVYDVAADIGKECEKIIELHGADAIKNFMPKVINALELLERLATKNERENTQVQELQAKILQLETDKIGKAEDRQRFEKVLNWLFSIYPDWPNYASQ